MIEFVGCIILGLIGIGFIIMCIDELRTNYILRKRDEENNK